MPDALRKQGKLLEKKRKLAARRRAQDDEAPEDGPHFYMPQNVFEADRLRSENKL